MTVRQAIRDAIIDRLNDGPPSDVPAAGKRRWFPGLPLTTPRLTVFFAQEGAQPLGGPKGPLTRRSLAIGVQAACAVEDPAEADDALEPLLAWVTECLGDTTLGGRAWQITERETGWDAIPADLIYLQAVVIFDVTYQTRRDDLTAAQ